MRKEQFFPSRWLGAADIGDAEVSAVISRADQEEVGEMRELKCVIHFEGKQKALICNLTNYELITAIAGSDDTVRWPGTEVVLYTAPATYRGKTAPAVRIKAPPSSLAVAEPAALPPASGTAPPRKAAKTGGAPKTSTLESDEIPF